MKVEIWSDVVCPWCAIGKRRFEKALQRFAHDAHRLIHLGAVRGVQDAVKERLLRAYLTEGERIGDPETLVRLGAEAGLDEHEAREVLASDRYTADVRADERQAQAYGITGVPFYVIDGRYGVSGAQPADALLQVLEQAWTETHPDQALAPGGACADGSCAV
jgi:predicted DsbA family dithiol-disulfide isomerase